MTDDLFLINRIQHTLHGSFHILNGLIDDSVKTEIYALLFSDGFCCSVRSYIKSDNDCIGSTGQRHIGLVNSTYASVDHFDYHFFVGQFNQTLLYSFHGTLYISLNDDGQFFQIACLDLAEQVIQRHFRFSLLQKPVFILRYKGCRKMFCLFIIFCHYQDFSGVRHIIQSQDLYRGRRTCFFYFSSLVIDHSSYFTGAGACCDKISYMKGALLYQDRSYRAFSFIQFCLDHKTSGSSVWICLQFCHFRCQQDHLQQGIDPLAGMSGNRHEDGTAAPVFRNQLVFRKLLFYSFHIGTRFIDLVDSNNDFHSCCLGMIDCFNSLRHNTIVGCYYQHGNIRGIGSSHTHGGKSLMSRRIQESDLLTINIYHISANMLGNSSSLTIRHMRLPDTVQKGSFSMVYMPHNTDYRRSWNQGAFFILFIL